MMKKWTNNPKREIIAYVYYFHPLERDRTQSDKRDSKLSGTPRVKNFSLGRTVIWASVFLFTSCVLFFLLSL